MKVSIIGAGNMGGATALGMKRFCPELEVTVTTAHMESLKRFENTGIKAMLDNSLAVKDADIVILGVKPWLVKEVLEPLIPLLGGKLLVSLAAGIPSSELKEWLSRASLLGLYTVIPNIAIEVGESMTFAYEVIGNETTRERISNIFEAVGKIQFTDEKKLNAGMMVASCGTAFALRYARAAMEGGVELGLYPRQALEAVLQTIKGAAVLTEELGLHPEQVIDKVTTPGGITIRGLNAMEEAGFSNAVIKGIKV